MRKPNHLPWPVSKANRAYNPYNQNGGVGVAQNRAVAMTQACRRELINPPRLGEFQV